MEVRYDGGSAYHVAPREGGGLLPERQLSPGVVAGTAPLLERQNELQTLSSHLAAVRQSGQGRLVFVGGEAGVGKTALIRYFRREHACSARVLAGACDALYTPRPLGPIQDMAPFVGGDFEALVNRGARPHVVGAELLRTLAGTTPSLLIIEDAHWADEATLDVLRFLGRRMEAAAALVIVTYRDELDRTHPLRILLGELLSADAAFRLQVAPLSAEAVASLARPNGADAEALFRLTAGNPFFVTEALAAGDVTTPPTLRDAVLARVARLPPAALHLIEAVAIVPQQTELWLLEQLAADALDQLDACLSSGILAAADGAVTFRHEIARRVIEDTLTPMRRTQLHRRALHALEAPPAGEPDVARLVHHAEATADAEAVLRHAPAAAERAALLGAHREAAAHFARALSVATGLDPAQRGEMFARHAYESFLADQFPACLSSGRQAVECYRAAGITIREGDALRQLARYLRCTDDAQVADEVGRHAVALLESSPPTRELARAYANAANVCMNAEDADGTAMFGQRAYALAQQLDDVDAVSHVLNTLGTLELLNDVPEGLAKLQTSLQLAQSAGIEEYIGRFYVNLGWAATRSRSYVDATRYLADGRQYCSDRGLVLWLHYVLAYGARCAVDQGRWLDAVELAEQVVRDPRTALPRVPALVAVGLVRARRGDPDAWRPLDEALALAQPTRELQHMAPVAAARAEVAWLEGKPTVVAEATNATLDVARLRHATWVVGELALWRRRAGLVANADGAAEPYAVEISGDWHAAAELWERRGCPYEAALARAQSNDESVLREALATLLALGARATAAVVTRRLRELGARDLPRGPRKATRSNIANLTSREIDVLRLMSQGLRNGEIATRLYLSPKTVDHHVSAIFAKLPARSRSEAIAYALAHELVPKNAWRASEE